MEKAVCYIRVSTEEQTRGGVSLAAQEEKLAAYCYGVIFLEHDGWFC